MKLVNAAVEGDEGLDVKKYPMPVKGAEGEANINGEVVKTKVTSGRGQTYTYFILSNVALYVAGTLDPEALYVMDLPEGFGSETPPAERKSYYVRKRPAKPGEGEIPAGASEVPGGGPAATTDPETGEAVVPDDTPGEQADTNPDGSTVEEPAEAPKKRRK